MAVERGLLPKGPRRHWIKTGKHEKRAVNKYWRRMAKLDPENAPIKRPTAGWAD